MDHLTETSMMELEKLRVLLPDVEDHFLIETSLAITAALYTKASSGATIRIEYPDGTSEELRFKPKKQTRKKK